jgi:hypothetical protein
MICHGKESAAALQICEDAISTLLMKGIEPLLEQAFKIHADRLHGPMAVVGRA